MGDRTPTADTGGAVATRRRGRVENLKPWKPGQSGNLKGGAIQSEAQKLAREMRANAQPRLVAVLLAIAEDPEAKHADRINAAKVLVEDVPDAAKADAAEALTVVVREYRLTAGEVVDADVEEVKP